MNIHDTRFPATLAQLEQRDDFVGRHVGPDAAETRAMLDTLGLDSLDQLVENVKMAKQAEPVLDHEGKPTGEYRQNLPAANKALELLGKELGMFVDRKEVRTGDLDDVPHEEKKAALEAIREEIRRREGGNSTVH